jgi:hypothetical protein
MSTVAPSSSVMRQRLPNRRAHTLLNIEAGGFRHVAGVGHYDDGRLGEVFLNAEKGGTAIDDAARDSAVTVSLAVQHGVGLETIRHALMRNGAGRASGPVGVLLDLLTTEVREAARFRLLPIINLLGTKIVDGAPVMVSVTRRTARGQWSEGSST